MTNMENMLLVDLGNSSLKWTFVRGGAVNEVNRISHQQKLLERRLDRVWADEPRPASVWVVAVASQSLQDDLKRWVETHWSVSVDFMQTEATTLGVTCANSCSL